MLIVVLFDFLNIKSVETYAIYFFNNTIIVQVRYIIIETKEFSRIGYNVFLFPHSYSGDGLGAMHLGLHLSTHAEKETRYIQYSPLLLFQYYCILYLLQLLGQSPSRWPWTMFAILLRHFGFLAPKTFKLFGIPIFFWGGGLKKITYSLPWFRWGH